MKLTSPDFKNGQRLPDRFALDHENKSPTLHWSDMPLGTKEVAIICDDPDAPMRTWVHWVIYGIPSMVTHLGEGVPKGSNLETLGGARQGKTDFQEIGYDGPRPPKGPVHRYFFHLYALKAPVKLGPGATAAQLKSAMEGKVIEEAELVGTYSR
jgi:Raf kinase inhibitor-like YbhB/YbcL family protein